MVLGGEPPGRVGRRRDFSIAPACAVLHRRHRSGGGVFASTCVPHVLLRSERPWQTTDDAAATARDAPRRSGVRRRAAARPAAARPAGVAAAEERAEGPHGGPRGAAVRAARTPPTGRVVPDRVGPAAVVRVAPVGPPLAPAAVDRRGGDGRARERAVADGRPAGGPTSDPTVRGARPAA